MSLNLSLENYKTKISAKAYLTIDDRVTKKNKHSGNNQSGRSSLTKMTKKNKK